MNDFERTFDNAAVDYDQNRPVYHKDLYTDLFQYKPIDARSTVLEIGIGTGKASRPILDAGCRLTGLEPGENLAAIAKNNLRNYQNFFLSNQTLQDYECGAETFDLIYAATAFHWIPEEYGYPRVYDLLKPGGVFARFSYHAGPDKERKALTSEIRDVYYQYMQPDEPKEFTEENAENLAALAVKYGFIDTKYHLYHSTKDFTADDYMGLLRTYSNHMALQEPNRQKLFDGIHAAISKNGGIITVYYTTDLELARKP